MRKISLLLYDKVGYSAKKSKMHFFFPSSLLDLVVCIIFGKKGASKQSVNPAHIGGYQEFHYFLIFDDMKILELEEFRI